ncbi:hypothetical protein, partial [Xanthomonas translucens]
MARQIEKQHFRGETFRAASAVCSQLICSARENREGGGKRACLDLPHSTILDPADQKPPCRSFRKSVLRQADAIAGFENDIS